MAKDPTLTHEAFAAAVPAGDALFGLDVGTKTIGIAIADSSWTIASAFHTIRRVKFTPDAETLLAMAAKENVGGIVIGMPLNLDGIEGPRAQSTRAFARSLALKTELPLVYWDERLSTVAAERTLLDADTRRDKRAEVIDKLAAAFILQGALDRMRRLRVARPLSTDGEIAS
jgi:putative holliday junction resolvase